MVDGRLAPDVLHNVDFATRGPAGGGDIASQHPEGRPNPLTKRHLNSGLEPAVALNELARCEQPGGCVIPRDPVGPGVVLFYRLDGQIAVPVEERVISTAGVILQLVISPTVSAYVVSPLRLVRGGAGGSVKLVRPGKNP